MAGIDTPSIEEVIANLRNAVGTATDTYVRPDYTNVDNANIYSIQQMQDKLGSGAQFTYDRNEIEKILQAAVDAQYAGQYQQQANTERTYYKNMATAQNTALDTARQLQGQAIASGASKGMQAANALSAILGISQTSNDEATKLAQDRQLLAQQEGAAKALASSQAMDKSNATLTALQNAQHQLYADEIQKQAEQLGYNQAINTDYAGYQASKYSADQTLNGTLASSGSNTYNNNIAQYGALQQALESAAAQRDAAATTAAATRYNADRNYASTQAQIAATKAAQAGAEVPTKTYKALGSNTIGSIISKLGSTRPQAEQPTTAKYIEQFLNDQRNY